MTRVRSPLLAHQCSVNLGELGCIAQREFAESLRCSFLGISDYFMGSVQIRGGFMATTSELQLSSFDPDWKGHRNKNDSTATYACFAVRLRDGCGLRRSLGGQISFARDSARFNR